MTSSNGTFSALLALCEGNSPVTGEFPTQRLAKRSFDVFFDLRPNDRLSRQWWGWWFETPPCPLWRHINVTTWSMCILHGTYSINCGSEMHRKISNISCNKSQNLNDSRLVSQFLFMSSDQFIHSTALKSIQSYAKDIFAQLKFSTTWRYHSHSRLTLSHVMYGL